MNDDDASMFSTLEEICFLYFKDGNLCTKKCNGYNKKCPQYIKYEPKKKIVDLGGVKKK